MRKSQQRTEFAQARVALNATREEFAEMLGVSSHTVVSLECGRLEPSMKLRLRLESLTGGDLSEYIERKVAAYRKELESQARKLKAAAKGTK